ncbi:hypothetical protein D1007_35636 [Hordeum vulgare]|nr:hypothetical protein D1007_35636 [Hordeum vulgare]
MSSTDSHFDGSFEDGAELALRIALERLRVDTGGSPDSNGMPHSLTTTETGARWLRRINVEQLVLDIEQSEWEATEAATEVARVAKLKGKQDCIVRCLHGYLVISDSSSSDGVDYDESDIDPPPAADGYNIADDRKGKGPAKKW